MKKYAVVNSENVVENIVLWDEASQWAPPENTVLVKVEDIVCGIGWKYENELFVDASVNSSL